MEDNPRNTTHGLRGSEDAKMMEKTFRAMKTEAEALVGKENLMSRARLIYDGDDTNDALVLQEIEFLIDRISFIMADLEKARERIDGMGSNAKARYELRWLEYTIRAENQLSNLQDKLMRMLDIDPLYSAKVRESNSKADAMENITGDVTLVVHASRPDYSQKNRGDEGSGKEG